MSTSTPNDFAKGFAEKYNLSLYINNGEKVIGQDWNLGVSNVKTDYVTVAIKMIYTNQLIQKRLKKQIEKGKDFVLAFTDYREIKNGEEIPLTKNLKIKKILLFPLKFFRKSKFIRRRSLSLGSAICCPSVTVNKKVTSENPYQTKLKCDLDWDTWDKYSIYKEGFLYISKELMFHRIHEE